MCLSLLDMIGLLCLLTGKAGEIKFLIGTVRMIARNTSYGFFLSVKTNFGFYNLRPDHYFYNGIYFIY